MVGEFSVFLNPIKSPSHLYSYQLGGGRGGGRGIRFCFKDGVFLFVEGVFGVVQMSEFECS